MSRAFNQKWNVDKEKIIAALMEVIEGRDPELLLDALDLARKMDLVDCKREELEIKKQADDNDERLRLLELAKSVPVADLARIASENGLVGRQKEG